MFDALFKRSTNWLLLVQEAGSEITSLHGRLVLEPGARSHKSTALLICLLLGPQLEFKGSMTGRELSKNSSSGVGYLDHY